MSDWQIALTKICEIYSKSDVEIEWILVGSIASVLQGCEMTPGDIDLYVKNQEGVKQFALLLEQYSLRTKCEEADRSNWFSSIEEPAYTETFPSGFTWTKGRWMIEGMEVEVVNISQSAGIPDSLDGDGIWEGGKYIWGHSKNVDFGTFTVPVVPLEIQLESNLRRKRKERIDAIMKKLKVNGYNEELILKALSTDHLSFFILEMRKNSLHLKC
ncbi:hypothetical protein V7201_14285 [Bacillus sp. JJ1122]|uniref:hypothetical protein n=1 Tax=Bacillus sp. JJ1122 TaxID=3122951 RepID=UPI0030009CFE